MVAARRQGSIRAPRVGRQPLAFQLELWGNAGAMIQRLFRCILWLCLAAPLAAVCAPPPQDMPNLTALLVDQTGLLDQEEQQSLLRRLNEIQVSGRAQVAI